MEVINDSEVFQKNTSEKPEEGQREYF